MAATAAVAVNLGASLKRFNHKLKKFHNYFDAESSHHHPPTPPSAGSNHSQQQQHHQHQQQQQLLQHQQQHLLHGDSTGAVDGDTGGMMHSRLTLPTVIDSNNITATNTNTTNYNNNNYNFNMNTITSTNTSSDSVTTNINTITITNTNATTAAPWAVENGLSSSVMGFSTDASSPMAAATPFGGGSGGVGGGNNSFLDIVPVNEYIANGIQQLVNANDWLLASNATLDLTLNGIDGGGGGADGGGGNFSLRSDDFNASPSLALASSALASSSSSSALSSSSSSASSLSSLGSGSGSGSGVEDLLLLSATSLTSQLDGIGVGDGFGFADVAGSGGGSGGGLVGGLVSGGIENSSMFMQLDNDDDDYDYLYRHSLPLTIVYCVAYVVVFIVGLVGNSFVIAVVLRAPRMRTVTNFFIVNLAVADILVIVFCLPSTLLSNIYAPWMLGWLMCKTVPYIQGVSVAASVYSLIAVSLDRFIAIWWPLRQMTKSRARFMILCIWIIAMGSTIPWALFFDLVAYRPSAPDMYLCQEVWPTGTNGNLYFLLAHLIACYLLPMLLITLCYVLIWIKVSTRSIPGDSKDTQKGWEKVREQSKVKVIKMLVAVVILFVLSWLPLYVIFTRIKFGGEISLEESQILDKVTPFAQWLGSSNSCINPILYAFFNKKYRRGFAAIIKSRSCCGRLRYYDNVAIASSTTSTRKSSHYHHHNSNHNGNSSRKGPSSPGLRKTNAVSYIYEHNSLKRHNLMVKQDSNLSQQMLLKQDSHGSRQYLIKQESASSDGSRRPLCQQDSNGSKVSLAKQDSVVSYMERRAGFICAQDSVTQDSVSIDSGRRSIAGSGSPTVNSMLEYKRQKFVKQDSVISFVDQRPEPRRHQLVKQDSVISFADQRRCGPLNKQDSLPSGHHVSILKKTDSQLSSGFSSPRRNIEIVE